MGERWAVPGWQGLPTLGSPASLPHTPPASAPAAGDETAARALRLYAGILVAPDLRCAGHTLCASLVADFGWSNATVALQRDGHARLLASTHGGTESPHDPLAQDLCAAMDEAVEQALSLRWPLADAADVAEPDVIRLAHEALRRETGAASLATVPLGLGGEVLGAVCVERADGRIDAEALRALEQVLRLAGPALRWQERDGQPWYRRAFGESRRAWERLRHPDRRMQRRIGAALAVATLLAAVVPLERTASGRARIEGAQQRVLAAATDGFVKAAHVRPGDRVKAGDALVDLLEGDLRLDRERLASQLAQHENAYAAAMAKSDRGTVSTSLSRMAEAQAQLALVDDQLARGRLVAPFDALVIAGDLTQSIGAPVRQGDPLLTLATTEGYRVIVDIDETDIGRVRVGEAGQLALSSLPWNTEAIEVTRIAPLAKAVEGRNVFEVEAKLLAPRPDLRPGLLGRAELVAGRMPPLAAWTTHLLDRLRVAWWSWLG